MRVVIAPDCFTGTLTAPQAAQALAEGWRRSAPADDLDLCPLSDGGPGFVDVLAAGLGGRLLTLSVPGPLGVPVPALLLVDGGTVYLESAQACGLHLIGPEQRDPGHTSTYGVGVLLREAVAAGAERVVVGLGGSGTNDGGAGLLAAVAGLDDDSRFAGGGLALAGVTTEDVAPLAAGIARWRAEHGDVALMVASDVDVPLLGFAGASLGFAPQKGASKELAAELEGALTDFAKALCAAADLEQRLTASPGAGAAGGLGFGLFALGAGRMPGTTAVLKAVGLEERLAGADLVVTGEGKLDWQSLRGKVIAGVARAALEAGVPAVAVAGQVEAGRRELLSIGLESAYPVARTPAEVTAALADPAGTLAARVARVARTWSH